MDTDQITTVLREGVWVAIKLGGPMLILSMAVGDRKSTRLNSSH